MRCMLPVTTASPPNGQKSSSESALVLPIVLPVVGILGAALFVALAMLYKNIRQARRTYSLLIHIYVLIYSQKS